MITVTTMESVDMSGRNILDKFRQWRLTGLGRAIEEGARQVGAKEMRFRIMNYNILAPVYADQHRHLYTDTEDSLLDWGYRWPWVNILPNGPRGLGLYFKGFLLVKF